jgi:methyltransferase (TIGR00027 family)
MLNKEQAILGKILHNIPDNIIYTPINFNTQNLDEILESKGLDSSKPTFFIWEGVTQYITKEVVENILDFISKSASGSRLVFTYILKSVIDGTSNMLDGERLVSLAGMGDQSWIFGLDPSEVSGYIKQYNLVLIENVGSSYLKENYLNLAGRKLNISDFERIIYAEIL